MTEAPIPHGDATTIRIDDPYEVRRWCQRLVCTAETLRDAVGKVGNDPNAVRAAIEKRGLNVCVRNSRRS